MTLLSVAALVVIAVQFLLIGFLLRSNRQQKEANKHLFELNQERLFYIQGVQRQREWYEQQLAELKGERQKYQDSGIAEKDTAELALKIADLFASSDAIYSPDFNLSKLAELVNSNSKYVSQAINQVFQKNFSTLLNECRIREACRQINTPDNYGHLTIEAIASNIGFKSRTSFIAAFKKNTGLTPSEYMRIAHETLAAK